MTFKVAEMLGSYTGIVAERFLAHTCLVSLVNACREGKLQGAKLHGDIHLRKVLPL